MGEMSMTGPSRGGRLQNAIILFSAFFFALSGCSSSNYGTLKSQPEVTRGFETYQILPGHKYYYRGTHSRPIVIVGIKDRYVLDSKLWVPIDPQSPDFRALIDKVSLQGQGNAIAPWGFVILDPAGNDVGVWYSAIRAAAVEINETGQITKLLPIGFVTKGDQPR
jgi:hypothetical protein